MKHLHKVIVKHGKKVTTHVRKHHKKYIGGAFAGFAVFKTIKLVIAVIGFLISLNNVQNTFADMSHPDPTPDPTCTLHYYGNDSICYSDYVEIEMSTSMTGGSLPYMGDKYVCLSDSYTDCLEYSNYFQFYGITPLTAGSSSSRAIYLPAYYLRCSLGSEDSQYSGYRMVYNLDKIKPTIQSGFNGSTFTGNECESISVTIPATDQGCGSGNLSYVWHSLNGETLDSSVTISSGTAGLQALSYSVRDGAKPHCENIQGGGPCTTYNDTTGEVYFQWGDVWYAPGNQTYNTGTITGSITIYNLLTTLGITVGDCEPVSIQILNSRNASCQIDDNNNLVIIPYNNLYNQTGFCELSISDDDGHTATGSVNFNVKTTPKCNESWDNDKFLSGGFWELNPTNEQIICALYGSGTDDDKTAYTVGWNGGSCVIENMRVVTTGTLPQNLDQNTIYVLNTKKIARPYTINMDDCTAIISKSGTILYSKTELNSMIENNSHGFAILDNIAVDGFNIGDGNTHKKNKYGIFVSGNEDYPAGMGTYNNVQVYNNKEFGIYFDHGVTTDFILNNIQIFNNRIGIYSSWIQNLMLNNIQSYNNGDVGIYLGGGVGNIMLNNVATYNNDGTGIYLNEEKGKLSNVYSFNNGGDGLFLEGNGIYYGILKIFGNKGNNNVPIGLEENVEIAMRNPNAFQMRGQYSTIDNEYEIEHSIWNYITNPKMTGDAYMLSFTGNRELLRGVKNLTGEIDGYSYGVNVQKQVQPMVFSGESLITGGSFDRNEYIGGETDVMSGTGVRVFNGSSNEFDYRLTGESSNVEKYQIFVLNEQTKSASTPKSLPVSLSGDENDMTDYVTQMTSSGDIDGNTDMVHEQENGDGIAPTVTLSWNGVECTTGGATYLVTANFSEVVTGITNNTLNIILGTVVSGSSFGFTGYRWTVHSNSTGDGIRRIKIGRGYYRDLAGNTGSESNTLSGMFDNVGPTYQINNDPIYECNTGVMYISEVEQEGCAGTGDNPYSWNGGSSWSNWSISDTYSLYSGGVGTKTITVRVRDSLGNYTEQTGSFIWKDSKITLSGNATGAYDIGNITGITVISNLTGLFNVTGYGSCESVTITTGECTNATMSLDGSDLTIIPSDNIEGTGSCEVYFSDGDTTKTGTINFEVDTKQIQCLDSWNNDNFLSGGFWSSYDGNTQTGHQQVICALYGSGENDKTAYTLGWSGRDYSQCSGKDMTVIETGILPGTLAANTIYVLNTGKVINSSYITMNNCSAIVSKSGSVLYSSVQISSKGQIGSNGKQYTILDNLAVDGKNDGNGLTHTGNKYGIELFNSNNNSLNNIQSFNNSSNGIDLNSNSNNNSLNNIQSFNNGIYGIGLYSGNNNSLNNIQSYNNKQSGILLYNSNNNSLNNIQSFNNGIYGIGLYSGNNNSLNNIQSYNNEQYGISLDSSSNNIYYGELESFENGNGDILNGLSGATDSNGLGWSEGQYTYTGVLSRDIMTNPVDRDGKYLLNWNKEFSELRGTGEIGEVVGYSYGSGIKTQQQPVMYSGGQLVTGGSYNPENYIGSNVKKISDGILDVSDVNNYGYLEVTGDSNSNLVSKYTLFGQYLGNVANENKGTSTGIQLIGENGNKRIITQLYGTNYFATHFQKDVEFDVGLYCLTGWDNDKFLDKDFWNGTSEYSGWYHLDQELQAQAIICALYGSGENDTTAYTKNWEQNICDWKSESVYIEPVDNEGIDPDLILGENNTIYVMNFGRTLIEPIVMDECSAIVSANEDSNGAYYDFDENNDEYNFDNSEYGRVAIVNDGKQGVILNGVRVSGFDDGIYFSGARNNTLHKVQTHDNRNNGILLSGTQNNIFDMIYSYNNAGNGINLNEAFYDVFNNIQIYNNQSNGIYASGGRQKSFNNVQSYGNGIGGIGLYNMDQTILNNIQVYQNSGYGVWLYDVNNTKLKDMIYYNNDLYESGNYNYYYGDYGYLCDDPSEYCQPVITGGEPIIELDWNESNYYHIDGNIFDWNWVTNPMNEYGMYMYDWGMDDNVMYDNANIRGFTSYSGWSKGYSYGIRIKTQKQPIKYVGETEFELYGQNGIDYNDENYIGSDVKKIDDFYVTIGDEEQEEPIKVSNYNVMVTGNSDNYSDYSYSVFGNIRENILGEDIGNSTGIELSGINGTKYVIGQIWTDNHFATHTQRSLSLEHEVLLTGNGLGFTGGLVGGEQCTTQTGFTITGTFSEAVTGVRLTGENVIIKNEGGISNDGTIYTWSVELVGGTGKIRVDGSDLYGNSFSGSWYTVGNLDIVGPRVTSIYPNTAVYTGNFDMSWYINNTGCAQNSGYYWNLYSGDCGGSLYMSGYTGLTYVPVTDLVDGTYCLSVQAIDKLGNWGNIKTGSFVVDTRPIACGFEEIGSCTSGTAQIELKQSGDLDDIYVWFEGSEMDWCREFCSNNEEDYKCVPACMIQQSRCDTEENYDDCKDRGIISTGTLQTGVIFGIQYITGYIYQEISSKYNTCVYNVADIIDNTNPTIIGGLFTGYECETITGNVAVSDEGCGSGKLSYSWSGLNFTGTSYGINNTGKLTQTIQVSVVDGAGNTETTGVTYEWLDRELTMTGIYNLGLLTGQKVISDLIGDSVFNVTGYGSCETVTITTGTCTNATMTLNGSVLTIIPSDDVEGTGSCEVYFTDGDTQKTGTINFEVDTKGPTFAGEGFGFTGGLAEGYQCTTRTGFIITGTFSEAVTGVKLTGEYVRINNEGGITNDSGITYTWEVELLGGIGEVRLTGNIRDLHGNELSGGYGSHYIVGNLDNVGPDTPILNTPDDGYSFDVRDITFTWNSGNTVTGCAGWSGYVFQISTGDDENFDSNIIEGRTEILTGKTLSEVGFENGTYYWRVISQDKKGNESVSEIRKFMVESSGASCVISKPENCSKTGVVTIKDDSDRVIKSITGSDLTWLSGDDSKVWTAVVEGKTTLSGIIIELSDGQTGMCSELTTSILDNTEPEISVTNVTGYECEMITGIVVAQTGYSCGKTGLDSFSYSWSGGVFTGTEYGISNNITGEQTLSVAVFDGVGNSITTGVTYAWLDTGVVLLKNETGITIQEILTGNYVGESGLFEIFEPREGACNTGLITISTGNCYLSGRRDLFTGVEVSLTGNNTKYQINIDGQVEGYGYCEVLFNDDDGNTATGKINFYVDTRNCLDERDNDHFLIPDFWGMVHNDNQVICALYGSGENDETAYTMGWSGYAQGSTCSGIEEMSVVWTGDLPSNLDENTVYVLTETGSKVTNTVELPNCTAIVSSQINGYDTVLYSDNQISSMISLSGKYGILDNVSVDGRNKKEEGTHDLNELGIILSGAESNTFNVVKVYNNTGDGIKVVNSQLNLLNNLQLYANAGAGIELVEGSIHNSVDNLQSYRNGTGIYMVDANVNAVNNINVYNNKWGLFLTGDSNDNVFNNLNLYYNAEYNSSLGLYQHKNLRVKESLDNKYYGTININSLNIDYVSYDNDYEYQKKSSGDFFVTKYIDDSDFSLIYEYYVQYYRYICKNNTGHRYTSTNSTYSYNPTFCDDKGGIYQTGRDAGFTHMYDMKQPIKLINQGTNQIGSRENGNLKNNGLNAIQYITNPRQSNGSYLYSWQSSIAEYGTSTISQVDQYSYGYQMTKQIKPVVWSGGWSTGGNVETGYYIGSNVPRITGNVTGDAITKVEYVFTGSSADTGLVDTFELLRGNLSYPYTGLQFRSSWADSGYSFTKKYESTKLTGEINTDITVYLNTGTQSVSYSYVPQYYGEHYFATHYGVDTVSVEAPRITFSPITNQTTSNRQKEILGDGLQISKKSDNNYCVSSGTVNMTGIWTGFYEYMTGFTSGDLHLVNATLGTGTFKNESNPGVSGNIWSWTLTGLNENVWASLTVSGSTAEDATEIQNVQNSIRYYYDTTGPVISSVAGTSVNECTTGTVTMSASDACYVSGYMFTGFVGQDWTTSYSLTISSGNIGRTGNIQKSLTGYTRDWLEYETETGITITINNIEPTVTTGNVSTGFDNGTWSGNLIDIFGVSEGNCGTGDLSATGLSCSGMSGTLYENKLEVEWSQNNTTTSGYCEVKFVDNEYTGDDSNSFVTGKIEFTRTGNVQYNSGWIETGYECEYTTGHVDFTSVGGAIEYQWNGVTSGSVYSLIKNVVTGYDVNVTGCIGSFCDTGVLHYAWQDTGVQLSGGNISIGELTGEYTTTTGDLIDLFGAREGKCGSGTITVTTGDCENATISIDDEGNVVITPEQDLDNGTGSCEVIFHDDDENSMTGTITFGADTLVWHCLDSWNNDNFLNSGFWNSYSGENSIVGRSQVICALYGSGAGDQTAYTMGWSGYDGSQCSGLRMKVVYTGQMEGQMAENTIYVLTGEKMVMNSTITGARCSAIVSRSGTTIYSENKLKYQVYLYDKSYEIFDNIGIDGNNITTFGFAVMGNNITLNNFLSYNYTGEGLDIYKSRYFILNNSQIYNNSGWGVNINTQSQNNILNNVQLYNNGDVGLKFTQSQNNILNNVQLYNNKRHGLSISGSQNNILNNVRLYNNGASGIYLKGNVDNNVYYGKLMIFGNGDNGDISKLTGAILGNNLGRTTGEYIDTGEVSRDMMTNPVDSGGNYLLEWNSDFGVLRGTREIGEVVGYSYGSGVGTQQQPVMYVNGQIATGGNYFENYYIGSQVEKVEGELKIPGVINNSGIIVTGTSDNGLVGLYSIFGNINTGIIGEQKGQSTGIELKSEGDNRLVVQLLNDNPKYFATHFEKYAILNSEFTLTEFTGGYGSAQCTTQTGFTITGAFSKSVTGVVLTGEKVEISDENVQGSTGYVWRVKLIGGIGKVRLNTGDIQLVDGGGQLSIVDMSDTIILGNYDVSGPNKVTGLSPKGRIYTNSTTLSWNEATDSGCAEVSGYNWALYSGNDCEGVSLSGGFTILTGVSVDDLENGQSYCFSVEPVDNYGNTGEIATGSFDVDTTSIGCEIIIEPMCTSGEVTVYLSGADNYDNMYLGWNGTGDISTMEQSGRIITGVTENGKLITGYIYQSGTEKSNICTGMVNNLDYVSPNVTVANVTGYECEMITGMVVAQTGDSCGKLGENSFSYSWSGGIFTGTSYGITQNVIGTQIVNVQVSDEVGNTTGVTVVYEWIDTGVQLSTGEMSIGELTGLYTITTGDLIDLFGAREGNCGSGEITVTTGNCENATISILNGNVTIRPVVDLDNGTGSCEVVFHDNDGNSETGVIKFDIDTKKPIFTGEGYGFTGGLVGEQCTTRTGFTITGIFSEAVTGVILTGENVRINDEELIMNEGGISYTWEVELIGGTGEVRLTGEIKDLNGNEISGDYNTHYIVGNYDNVGPNKTTLNYPLTEISINNPTLSWNNATDSGCAGMSGYNWALYPGNDCEGDSLSGGFVSGTGVGVSDLNNGQIYCRGVQPVDDYGNTGEWSTGTFTVNTDSIGCEFEVVDELSCTSGTVQVKLIPENKFLENIYLSFTGFESQDLSGASQLLTTITQSGQVVTGYIYQSGLNKTGVCYYTATNIIDQIKPTIDTGKVSVYECTTGTAVVTGHDEGCSTGILYSWSGGNYGINNHTYSLYSGGIGTRIVNVKVKDSVGNETGSSVEFEWTDSAISGHDFTGNEKVGNSGVIVNWKTGSEVSDGACGSGTIEFSGFVSTGSHGTCTTGEGDEIIYTPNIEEEYEGSDSCRIQVKDDEGSGKIITITFTGIDTKKPTCEINYNSECTSGGITLSMTATGASQYSWTGFDGMSGSKHSIVVESNGIYYGYVKDPAGNTGSCSRSVNNISTGVLSAPTNLSPASGTNTNTIPRLSRSGVSSNGCRNVSGYEVLVLSGNVVSSGIVNSSTTNWTPENLGNGTYEWYVVTHDTLGGRNESEHSMFIINDNQLTCSITNNPNQCTSGIIELVMSVSNALTGSYDGWTMSGTDHKKYTRSVNENTGFNFVVTDIAGNTGLCEVLVNNFDDTDPIITGEIINATGYECETITGYVQAEDSVLNCGGLVYNWNGGLYSGENKTGYGIRSDVETGYDVLVQISDGAGNMTGATVHYTWIGRDITLGNSGYNLGIITGTTMINDLTGDSVFNVTGYGNCETVTITTGTCTNATMTFDGSDLTIVPNDNIEGTGSCEVYFSDGDTTKTGVVTFDIDTKKPQGTGVNGGLIGGNGGMCTNQKEFVVTGTFTEAVTGVILTGEHVRINNEELIMNDGGISYSWEVELLGGTGKVWLTGNIVDLMGNSLSGTVPELILGDYDGLAPNKTTLVSPQGIVPFTNTTLKWTDVVDIGCAGLSGYNWRLYSGNCEGAPLSGGFTIQTGADVSDLINKQTYCRGVQPIDNNGNTGEWATGVFIVDTGAISCSIVADRNTCGSGNVRLTLRGSGQWLSWTNVGNTGTMSGVDSLVKTVSSFENITGYTQNLYGQTGYCVFTKEQLELIMDKTGSHLSGNTKWSGYECTTGIINMNVDEDGCGSSGMVYKWNNVAGGLSKSIFSTRTQALTGIFSVTNGAGITVRTGYTFEWIDSPVTAVTGFMVDFASVNSVNWKNYSQATDGACGSGTLTAIVTGATKGICSISGDNLIYTPNEGMTGSDSCILTISDDDGGSGVDVQVQIENINPYVELITPENDKELDAGEVHFEWIPVDVPSYRTVTGYVYTIGDKTGFTNNTGVDVSLSAGIYPWSVFIVYADGKTGGNSRIRSVKTIAHYSDNRLPKDYCPYGDNSDSYYDGVCDNISAHEVANLCGINESKYTSESRGAYLYAYLKGITTQCPIQNADLDGYLYRDQLAKMISVYAINVVGRKPNYGKTGCDQFSDMSTDTKEFQDYMKLSCELGLMGLNEDGVTPKTYFDPHSIVTRAEFGTVFSRLLFGDMYNVKNGPEVRHIKGYWYRKHLQALKDYGVMTKVDGDWPEYKERRGRTMLMLQRADNYGIFEGKSPAKNGVDALFTKVDSNAV